MKRNCFLVFLSFFFVLLGISIPFKHSFAQTYQIATYNIRFDNPNDIGNLWKDRSPHLINQIKFHKMGIIGTQEGLYHQLEEMKGALNFPYIGIGRDKGGKEGEFSAIFYNPEIFTVLDHSTFWLSESPEKPSKGWDAALNRVCTWGKFEDQTGNIFYVFNIHYDHVGQKAREESSKLVVQKVREINKGQHPVIFMGDFNVTPDNPAYATVLENSNLQDSRLVSQTPSIGNQGTFNGYNWERLPDGIIDHIFVSPEIKVLRHGILTDNYGLKYPSDHFPVMIEFTIN
ncbi:endonuclease/exonuclease/phosphatase family protein [Aquiflexum sp.]|uniref:endonuclease/exonuclease/phosphatase family protein n=1 Tax=Aquiflexum sp. TaxID=1872584 RepID=UPI0035930ED9